MDELLNTAACQFDRSILAVSKPGMVMQRADGSIEACNAEAEMILGWTLNQVQGWSSIDFSAQAIHLDGSPFPGETHPAMETLRTGLPCQNVMMGLYRPDGSLIWLLIDSQPLFRERTARTCPDAVVVTFADVTSQVQADAVPFVTMQGRQPMLDSLRQNQQFTSHLINTIPGVLHLFDVMAGRSLYVSEQARNLLGYTPEQVIEPGFLAQVMHPDDRTRLPQHFDRLASAPADALLTIEYRMRHANGEWRWFASQDCVFARTPDGQVQQVLGIAQDISDRKQAELDLQRSEITAQQQLAELEFIYATAPIGLCFLDRELRFVRINDYLAEINGLPAAEHIGRTVREIIPEMADQLEPLHRHVLDTGEPILNLEVSGSNRAQPGVWRDWLVSYYPLQQGDRAIGINVMVQEITDRRRQQEALQQRQQRLSLATSAAGLGVFDWDVVSDIAVWENQQMYEIFGRSPEDAPLSKTEFLEVIHPDDRTSFEQALVAGAQPGNTFHIVCRIRRADNEWRWVESSGQFTLASDGTPLRMLGVVRDITHRKQAEIDLHESREQLQMFVQYAPASVAMFDRQMRYIQVSQRWIDAYHLDSVASILGRSHYEVFPEIGDRWKQIHQRCLAGATERCDEDLFVRADGSQQWVRWEVRPWHLSSGEIGGIIVFSEDITDRKQIEIALHRSNAILNTINESTTTLIYVKDCDGRMLLANSAAIAALGKPEAEVIGKTALEFCQPREAAEQILANDRLVMDSGETIEFEETLEMSAGRTVYLSVKSPYRDEQGRVIGLIGVSTDISDRKQAEANLRNSEARYRILTEAIPQLVFVTAPDGQNEYVNQQFCRYTGLTEAQLLGAGWLAIVHPDDLENTHRRWLAAVQTGSFYEVEYRLRSADGQYRWFLGQGIPLKDDRGCAVKWFGTCTDIHEQKQIEVERSRLLAQEQAAREQAEAANRIKDEFLAILSHELRTPLNPILGWAKLLQTRSFAPDKLQTALATIERNAQLQVQLIDDLLDVSRIIRGKLTLNLDSVSLTEVIGSALETVRLAAEAKSIAIDTQIDSHGTVLGDAGRLQQIVWNLLSNAIKFTPNGGRVEVRLGIRDQRLEVRKTAEGIGDQPTSNPQSLTPNISALITISDTGRGISADFLPHIFEAFRQQDGSTTRAFGGLGLGLAIVRQLVELHGGTITAESAGDGQGATFTVELPLMAIAQPSVPLLGDAIADLQGVRVLAVDDEVDSLEILAALLEQEGAIITAVNSTAQAIAALQGDRFDLLISDIGMPEADGYVLIEQVRTLPTEVAKIPAIALTAYASEGDRHQVLTAGYQQHLAKPIEPDLLIRSIAQLVW